MMATLPTLLLPTAWAILSLIHPTSSFSSPRIRSFGRNDLPLASLSARSDSSLNARKVDLCIIGAGISGLAAAITTAEKTVSGADSPSILILEADIAAGGRVRSDYTDDGYILDRGFAVFIEQYPLSKQLLDYDALKLQRFLPGARVKLLGRDKLASVSDPLRRRRDIFRAIASPVGSPLDKSRLLPLFYTVMTKSIDDLFAMEETDTLTCLRDKYKFSEDFISSFFAPFLEGIYLAPLEEQSSRMFHFVMKMVAVGSTALPRGGMQAVANQLESKANSLGVEIQYGSRALSIQQEASLEEDAHPEYYLVEVGSEDRGMETVQAKSVIVATDVHVAGKLLSGMEGCGEQIKTSSELPQRKVGCIYYGLKSPAPLTDPMLILNGEGYQHRNIKEYPINNICFPSVVQNEYAPNGYDLCSVSILEKALTECNGDEASLDAAVRKQLASWFPDHANDILDETAWVKKGAVYNINNAQPVHYGHKGCANVHGGRDSTVFQGTAMPSGLFVCGDHMATSSFNGALESGVNAGDEVVKFLAQS